MIGIDTNVLIRYLTKDDAEQTPRARALVDSLTHENPGYITVVVMVEAFWVLTSKRYGYTPKEAANALGTLALSEEFVVEHELPLLAAVTSANVGGGFADVLIAHVAKRAGCSRVVTFDQDAADRLALELL
jgi:predicted nucleic-acid-binding protein